MGPQDQTGHNYFPSETVTRVALSGKSELTRVLAMFALRNSTDINLDSQMARISAK